MPDAAGTDPAESDGPRWDARFLVGASHKMYFTADRTLGWTEALARIAASQHGLGGTVQLFVVPGVLNVDRVRRILPASVAVGVQDISEHALGAWTGDISAEVAAELGCTFAEIGHAERRRHHGETDAVVARKVARAYRSGLIPLVCVGEEQHVSVAEAAVETIRQIESAVSVARAEGLGGRLIVAYEPVWAIGAPAPADDTHIRSVARSVRDHLGGMPGFEGARLVYGGAAAPGLLARVGDDLDGVFLGRFAHDPAAIDTIIDEAVAAAAPNGGHA